MVSVQCSLSHIFKDICVCYLNMKMLFEFFSNWYLNISWKINLRMPFCRTVVTPYKLGVRPFRRGVVAHASRCENVYLNSRHAICRRNFEQTRGSLRLLQSLEGRPLFWYLFLVFLIVTILFCTWKCVGSLRIFGVFSSWHCSFCVFVGLFFHKHVRNTMPEWLVPT